MQNEQPLFCTELNGRM